MYSKYTRVAFLVVVVFPCMLCPQCQTQLTSLQLDGITVDHCHVCGGTFFDAGEMQRIIPSDLSHLMAQKSYSVFAQSTMKCPKDSTPLQKTTHNDIPHFISLYYCSKCSGIFTYQEHILTQSESVKNKQSEFSRNSKIVISPHVMLFLLGMIAILAGLSIGFIW